MAVVQKASTEQLAHQAAHRRKSPTQLHLPMEVLAETGMSPEDAYDLISSDLLLDGSARLNLATFVPPPCPSGPPASWPRRPTRT